jgi:lipid II:glycine glycyltransferase (peptidoglycan interpeptide bridge formation enzyme)
MINEVRDPQIWDQIVRDCLGHPLQQWGWGLLKSENGNWQAAHVSVLRDGQVIGGAQILRRILPSPLPAMLYIPRGPFATPGNHEQVISEIVAWAGSRRALLLKVEPEWPADEHTAEFLTSIGLRPSNQTVLLSRTLRLDLRQSDDELLAAMSKKTRQYIRKSERSGVQIRQLPLTSQGAADDDLDVIAKIYEETAERAGFPLHSGKYYADLARFCGPSNQIYIAEEDGQPLSFLWNLTTASCCFELYGGMNDRGQQLRSNFTLKWHAIQQARAAGALVYDLNGLVSDGVTNFKLGFGNESDLVGTWDLPLSKWYGVWQKGLPLGRRAMKAFDSLRKHS